MIFQTSNNYQYNNWQSPSIFGLYKQNFLHVNRIDALGQALIEAASQGDTQNIEFLIAQGANVNFADHTGKTAVVRALQKKRFEAIKILVDSGADLTLVTPYLVSQSSVQIIELVLNSGFDPCKVDRFGASMLTHIRDYCKLKHRQIREIVQKSFDPTKKAIGFDRQYTLTKLLAHAFELAGVSRIYGVEVDWEGMSQEVAAETMAKYVRKFSMVLPNILNKDLSSLLIQSLEFAARYKSEVMYKFKVDTLKPIFILTGSLKHSVIFLIWQRFLIVSNRSQLPTNVIGECNEKKFNEKFFKTVLSRKLESIDNLKKILISVDFQSLPDFEKIASLPPQKVGNCSWASLEGGVYAFLFLAQWGINIINGLSDIEEPKKVTDCIFYNWLFFLRLNILDRYIDKIDKNDWDENLVYQCFTVLYEDCAQYAEILEESIVNGFAVLEKKYLLKANKAAI